jgi:hypothetical protein
MAQSGRDGPVFSLERERERTIETLSQHFAHDNISLEELERRIDWVYKATSLPALREITRDLPTAVDESEQRSVVAVPEAFAPERDRIVSIMAETKRRGLWRPPRHLDLWCIMSDTRLDLTEAQLSPGVTEIHLRALMASVRIIVPPGVRVVVQPSAFMSTVSDEMSDQPAVGSGAPVVRITGPLVMAELKVRVRTVELTY